MHSEILKFEQERSSLIESYSSLNEWKDLSNSWMQHAFKHRYMYNFTSLGRPVIQTPVDMVAVQEIIWQVKPDLIVETGVAHGGSLILSASMLALLDVCEAIESGTMLDPAKSTRRVLGIDIDIRSHNRHAIESHPMASRIKLMQGSSIDMAVVEEVTSFAKDYEKVLVFLDSNHTHEHVLAELNAYSGLASVGSYCVVFDTIVEDMPDTAFPDRPWCPGNNPKTAVWEFLESNKDFQIDDRIQNKLMLTVAPDGYLLRVR